MSKVKGFSLLEVLVSLLILSLALLGLELLNFSVWRETIKAGYQQAAEQQLNNLAERLGLRAAGQPQLAAWQQENQELLPQPKTQFSGTYPNYKIQLSWGAAAADGHAGMLIKQINL